MFSNFLLTIMSFFLYSNSRTSLTFTTQYNKHKFSYKSQVEMEENRNPGRNQGRGIHIDGHASFNNRLVTRLNSAPSDLMHFLEACAMGNMDRVNCLIEKGVDVNTTGTPNSPDVLSGTSGLMMAAMSNQVVIVS